MYAVPKIRILELSVSLQGKVLDFNLLPWQQCQEKYFNQHRTVRIM